VKQLDASERLLLTLNNLGCTVEEKGRPRNWIEEHSGDRIDPTVLEDLVHRNLVKRVSDRYHLTWRGILTALSWYS